MPSTDLRPGIKPPDSRIEIRLHKVMQLFNSFDPSPFISKDLDDEAEAYIVDSLAELSHTRSVELVIYLPPSEIERQTAEELAGAIHSYFGYRQTVTGHKLKALFWRGRVSLLLGLMFLGICTFLIEALGLAKWGHFGDLLKEGLLIIGWVANWRPVEIFLYDWWPLRREARLYGMLSSIRVRLLPS